MRVVRMSDGCDCQPGPGHRAGCPHRDFVPDGARVPIARDADGRPVCPVCGRTVHDMSCEGMRRSFAALVEHVASVDPTTKAEWQRRADLATHK